MKAYVVVFLATQIIVVCEENLAALFTGQAKSLHTVKDEKGVIKAVFRWEAVSGVFETAMPNVNQTGNLVVPRLVN
jgi:hypothetical protein